MIAPNFVTTVLLLCMLAHAAPSPRPATETETAIGSPAHQRAIDWLAKEDYPQATAAIREERRDKSLSRTLIARARKAALPNSANWVAALNRLLSPLGLQVSGDASNHGRYWSLNYGFDRSARKKVNKHNVPWQQPFVGWNSYKANGVNLGSWLEVEQGNTANVIPSQYPDEWSFCAGEGKAVCGPVLENHYATWYTTADVDLFAKYGINTLRIPTTYANWLDVPGSQLYHGNQLAYLRTITNHAVSRGMHVIIGLHSLPGGTNFLDIGEALTHIGWWYNATNFDYSLQVADKVIDFIQSSANPKQFTFAPINEPCDNFDNFATPNTVSYPDGVNYLNSYFRAVYAKIQKVNRNIPMMITDAFMGASYWAPYYTKGMNVVFDSHFYFFAAAGVYSEYVPQITCGQASSGGTTDFPVFVGEFSLESKYNNSLSNRQSVYQSQIFAYSQYLSGSAFWNGKLDVDQKVDGEGGKNDYWSLENLIKDQVVLPGGSVNSSYC